MEQKHRVTQVGGFASIRIVGAPWLRRLGLTSNGPTWIRWRDLSGSAKVYVTQAKRQHPGRCLAFGKGVPSLGVPFFLGSFLSKKPHH
jgi:hypothetical protein